MPAWPTPPGRKCITVELPTEQVDHLDREADYLGCTRVAYLRQLILRDMGRLAQSKAPPRRLTPCPLMQRTAAGLGC
jgi:hypothetical protein